MVSLIVAAYNEEEVIERKVANARSTIRGIGSR